MTRKVFKGQIIVHIIMLAVFAALFVTGTFTDEAIAAAVYMPGNIPAVIMTMTGVYPFFASAVLFIGALIQRIIHSGYNKPLKAVFCVVCAGLVIFSGYEGGKSFLSVDGLGGLLPELSHNIPLHIIVGAAVSYPLLFVGYKLASKSEDKLLAKRIIVLVAVMLMALLSSEILKNVFSRPRYRIATAGYDGIGFVPWYERFSGAADYISSFGLEKTDFSSFPSGHSVLGISCTYILLSLTWLFPKLQKRNSLLLAVGIVFGILVMISRMLLGAHYLSDVAAGAFIGTVFSLVYTIAQHSMSLKNSSTIIQTGE